MAKAYTSYTTARYIIDAPMVAISYLLAARFSGKSLDIVCLSVHRISLAVWYIAASFSRLYADRRSNKYSEEIVFIVYTIILFTILLSSVSFFLRNFIQFNSNFFTFYLLFIFADHTHQVHHP
jgi:putative colanic acid biosynthesis UDP-glucose lipid carrier transferase